MRPDGRLPRDQAEIAFSDCFVEQLAALRAEVQEEVLADVVTLCERPGGSHTLSADGRDRTLVGWNTLEVCGRDLRVVYKVDEADASIYVLCMGPRRAGEVYDQAKALARSGLLSSAATTQLWEAIALLDVLAEELGLDGWDYRPPAAPAGMRRAAVAAGLVDEAFAQHLSQDELAAAMEHGWGPAGPDPARAAAAAMQRARTGVGFDSARWVIHRRSLDRCEEVMPRAGARCIRRSGHPGVHRASP